MLSLFLKLVPIRFIALAALLLAAGYVKAPPDTAYIISGLRKTPRILIGRAGFKLPFFERVDKLYLGQMTVDIKTEQSVPTLFMVQQGVGASVLTPLISILIILGAVTTAVNMVAAMVRRIGNAIETEAEKKLTDRGRPIPKTIVTALVCCLADFGIAQFGLLTLIQRAYSTIAYLAIPVILIPYIIHMIVTRFDTVES